MRAGHYAVLDGTEYARGHFNPELQILDKAPVPAGAEMWKISQYGTRTLVARTGTLKRWEIAT